MAQLTVADSEPELTRIAAERVAACAEQAIAVRGSAVISLTGGTTPKHLYEALADPASPWRARIDWPRVHLFWGDERHVPPDHADSNFGMADGALVRHVPIPSSQVHRMRGDIADAAAAAQAYEEELRTGFALAGRADRTFDLMLLGMGEDAHITSIFPGSPLLRRPIKGRPTDAESDSRRAELQPRLAVKGRPTNAEDDPRRAGLQPRLAPDDRVAAVWAPHLDAWRITLTPEAILDARSIVMLVAGDKKALAVRAALEDPLDIAQRPAQLLREAGNRVEWLLDRPAASLLAARSFTTD